MLIYYILYKYHILFTSQNFLFDALSQEEGQFLAGKKNEASLKIYRKFAFFFSFFGGK